MLHIRVKPESVEQALIAWDAGHEVETVEMGGMGEGYEMAIQCVAFEILRALQNDDHLKALHGSVVPGEQFPAEFRDALDAVISEADAKQDDGSYKLGGLSGAQAGAAKNLALNLYRNGWDSAREQVPERMIFVRKQNPADLYEQPAA